MKFNSEQQNIINNIFGSYLVNAPVGTGKTSVLTARVLRALEEGIEASEILALTFTNRAADEMKTRIKNRIDDKATFDALSVSTFHSFCAQFLKTESKRIGLNSDFLIFDDDEQVELFRSILGEKNNLFEKPRDILNLLDEFYKYRLTVLQIDIGHNVSLRRISPEVLSLGNDYLKKLKELNALDFNELVLKVLELLLKDQEINERWSSRYRFIQLDEFQDTHLSEYLVIKELAKKHKNISLIGDIDQTIYSFRDSRPVFIAELFKKHFKNVQEFSLSTNYRSDPRLISALRSVLKNMEEAKTKNLNSQDNIRSDNQGKVIKVFSGYNFAEEVSWVIDNIKKIKSTDKQAKIAVLTRANFLINKISTIFSENNISFLTVDQYDFFRRQEIKDIFAYLKILLNKADLLSAKRVVERPSKNIGEKTLKSIYAEGADCGLNLSDFLNFKNYNFKEPFGELIEENRRGRIIVFDTETTGINPVNDNIVQIYAREVVAGRLGKEFHHYLKSDKSVGSAYFVHKISDEFLQEKGENPKDVLLAFKDFVGDSIVLGHNITFDINMVKENSKRYNINFEPSNYYDTLDLARRFLDLDNYKLSNISQKLKFKMATHSADDDVDATLELFFFLEQKLRRTGDQREALWNKYKAKFINLSSELNNLEKKIDKLPPVELIDVVWKESGLAEYYKQDVNSEQRNKSFQTLKNFFQERQRSSLDNRSALHDLLHYSSLVKNIDFLGIEGGKIPVVTIHQVKGLEFDYVFLLGLNEGIFPFFKTEDLEEEKRLFYVALSRARKEVYLSHSKFNDYNYPVSRSRLIDTIDSNFVDFI